MEIPSYHLTSITGLYKYKGADIETPLWLTHILDIKIIIIHIVVIKRVMRHEFDQSLKMRYCGVLMYCCVAYTRIRIRMEKLSPWPKSFLSSGYSSLFRVEFASSSFALSLVV